MSIRFGCTGGLQSSGLSSVPSGSPARSLHERVVPVLSVEGRPRADDPAVLSDEPGRGVIAVLGGVVGTEDPAGVPGLDPFGEACRGGAGGDHGASLAPGRDEMQGEDRQGVEGAVCEDHGVRPIGFPRHPEAAARGDGAGRRGGRGAAAGKISAPRASPAAFRRTNTALPWRSDTDSA